MRRISRERSPTQMWGSGLRLREVLWGGFILDETKRRMELGCQLLRQDQRFEKLDPNRSVEDERFGSIVLVIGLPVDGRPCVRGMAGPDRMVLVVLPSEQLGPEAEVVECNEECYES